ncbi:MAG: hypothetical protein E4H15_04670 [Syntrophobacterales bacterium]|nr:MAG: hypothetical protein E4H15_04670 [Syntrophobacterales bacterium]
MRSILDVFSRTWFINVILAVCVAFLGAKSIGVWVERGDGTKTAQVVAEKSKKWDIKKVTRGGMSPEVAYGVVTDKDLFSPDRVEPVEEEEKKAVAEADMAEDNIRISGKKIILYGVVMMDDYRAVLISDPQAKPPKRPFLWVKEAESIGGSGVVISTIKKESVILRKGASLYEIPLYDQEKTRERAVAREQQQPQEQPMVVTTQPPAVETLPSPAAKPATAPVTKPESKVTTSPEGEKYRIIKTPFGNIKRRIE